MLELTHRNKATTKRRSALYSSLQMMLMRLITFGASVDLAFPTLQSSTVLCRLKRRTLRILLRNGMAWHLELKWHSMYG